MAEKDRVREGDPRPKSGICPEWPKWDTVGQVGVRRT